MGCFPLGSVEPVAWGMKLAPVRLASVVEALPWRCCGNGVEGWGTVTLFPACCGPIEDEA